MVIASESGAVGDREARTSTALQMNFLGELGDPIQISDIRTLDILFIFSIFFTKPPKKMTNNPPIMVHTLILL